MEKGKPFLKVEFQWINVEYHHLANATVMCPARIIIDDKVSEWKSDEKWVFALS